MSRRLAGLANRGADLARLLDALEDQRRCSTAQGRSQGAREFDELLSQPSGLASADCPEEEGSWSSCSPMPVTEALDLFEQCVPHHPAPPFLRSPSAHQGLAFLNEFDFSHRRCVVRDLRFVSVGGHGYIRCSNTYALFAHQATHHGHETLRTLLL
jgi:hypothetical protein